MKKTENAPLHQCPWTHVLTELTELRALSRELLRLGYQVDEYAARIQQSLAAQTELQWSFPPGTKRNATCREN